MPYAVIDNCPVPVQIAPQVRLLKHAVPSAVLQSAYRGEDARPLLRRLHKHTQAYLYAAFAKHLPGFLPANRPGTGTHECRSDGVAYRGPVGRPLAPWQCGLDWNVEAVPKLIEAARHFGWDLFQPYPSTNEAHHTNFRSRPKMPLAQPKATPARPSRVSSAGLALVASFEGLRLAPYQDVAGVWTIGYGHTLNVVPKTHKLASAAAAKVLLRTDLTIYASAVRRLVRAPLTQRQFDALVSLAYNIGVGNFESSTLRKQLNAEHYARAANQFLAWNRAGGKVQPGLVRRRQAERAMFLAGSNHGTRIVARTGVK
jgi:lysozyme